MDAIGGQCTIKWDRARQHGVNQTRVKGAMVHVVKRALLDAEAVALPVSYVIL